jgi:flavin-dependent dehydrogenase
MAAVFDAIVVGARCAGSPVAMLLARKGHHVLVVDRASFPSDTLSTHLIHNAGVAALHRWGLLEALVKTGCPPISRYGFDLKTARFAGYPRPAGGVAFAYSPRRRLLDHLLVGAATSAGAELRERFVVEEVLFDNDRAVGIRGRGERGGSVSEKARIVIGADGLHSLVGRAVRAPRHHEQPTLTACYYSYWSGVPTDGAEVVNRIPRVWAAFPTNDDLTCIAMGWPRSEFEANRRDVEGTFMRGLELAPEFAERVRGGRREERFCGTGDMPNFFRKPFGPGWALVGDAGYHKDPCTATGITDAFRDAELLAYAVDVWLKGEADYEAAMGSYERARNERALPLYEITCEQAAIQPPRPEMQRLLEALQADQEAADDFASAMAGSIPASEFFAPDNLQRILSRRRTLRRTRTGR